ncbi:MAG TPA: cation transporter [Solirubrobacteraceae bacterium]|nr:cation transporter [Solirubrobacteraceae bacterium]
MNTYPLDVVRDPVGSEARELLVERARRLVWIGLAWHCVEAAVALAAGLVASSIALVGFGADSLIELLAGGVMLWRFAAIRSGSDSAEHAGHRLISLSFYAVAAYVLAASLDDLVGAHHPACSWVGIALALLALATMPPLALAKRRVAERLASPTARGESRQTLLCAYLALALLVGLAGNALLGLWWLDPAAAMIIAVVAAREGAHAWRGEGCCAALPPSAGGKHAHAGHCSDDAG